MLDCEQQQNFLTFYVREKQKLRQEVEATAKSGKVENIWPLFAWQHSTTLNIARFLRSVVEWKVQSVWPDEMCETDACKSLGDKMCVQQTLLVLFSKWDNQMHFGKRVYTSRKIFALSENWAVWTGRKNCSFFRSKNSSRWKKIYVSGARVFWQKGNHCFLIKYRLRLLCYNRLLVTEGNEEQGQTPQKTSC